MNLSDILPLFFLLLFFVGVWLLAFNAGKNRGILQERRRQPGSQVPNMPNHPDMPELSEEDEASIRAAIEMADNIHNKAGKQALIGRSKLSGEYKVIETDKELNWQEIGKAPEVSQDHLIDALMDMRLENFLCAHTTPAHAGTDLYYLSRKETAEYLLDMYHITPKAKH